MKFNNKYFATSFQIKNASL